jgi:flagellar hook-basal body complex protein FliE
MAIAPLAAPGTSPATAAARYAQTAAGTDASAPQFGAMLTSALQGVVDAGHVADAQSRQALLGSANLTDVVNAVSQADLALQTTTAIRDRVVQAYQDIMKMPI